jgi:predicted enzyme related to lactoylglutathione lyase
MAVRDSHAPGTPSWVDLATSDPDAAKQFYGSLFGWSFEDMPMDEGVYSMASVRGRTAAAISGQFPDEAAAGVPPHWQMYITVADVDAAAATVEGAGGAVVAPPFDVFDAGRMSVVTDPAGAFVMLWQPKEHIGCGIVNEPGAFTWSELVAEPNDATAAFYESVVGLKMLSMPMPDGTAYDGFTLDGTDATMVGGSMAPQMPGTPPHWTIYFGAADVDAAAAQVKELGGTVMAEAFDIPVGRMAVCADPQGAIFNLFQMPPADA